MTCCTMDSHNYMERYNNYKYNYFNNCYRHEAMSGYN